VTEFTGLLTGEHSEAVARFEHTNDPGSEDKAVEGGCHIDDEIRSVWLLVGSTGAGDALQTFLNYFRTAPPVAFIYAQHYDPLHQEHLRELTLENSAFTLRVADRPRCMGRGRIVLVPPRNQISISSSGCVSPGILGWRNRYTPHIDQLLKMFAAVSLPAPGVIFFSGMGSDGVAGLSRVAGQGLRAWAQDPVTAVCGAMPQAAISTGHIQHIACPAGLAAAVAAEI
jgi:chemosensory pili system protein ChpB (putative protein-glutamate methylesterase)